MAQQAHEDGRLSRVPCCSRGASWYIQDRAGEELLLAGVCAICTLSGTDPLCLLPQRADAGTRAAVRWARNDATLYDESYHTCLQLTAKETDLLRLFGTFDIDITLLRARGGGALQGHAAVRPSKFQNFEWRAAAPGLKHRAAARPFGW